MLTLLHLLSCLPLPPFSPLFPSLPSLSPSARSLLSLPVWRHASCQHWRLHVQQWLHQEEGPLHCRVQASMPQQSCVCGGGGQARVSLQAGIRDEEEQVHALNATVHVTAWLSCQWGGGRSTTGGEALSSCVILDSSILCICPPWVLHYQHHQCCYNGPPMLQCF
ncbi:unnamed protein product [Closterium sp. Yama58-4]|nr:unnamed protein product [Closterium sp. Yama58-4]